MAIGSQLGELLSSAGSVDFDASIAQIFGVAAEIQLLRDALSEITEAHALHHSRDEVAFGLFRVGHRTEDCNREGFVSQSSAPALLALLALSLRCASRLRVNLKPAPTQRLGVCFLLTLKLQAAFGVRAGIQMFMKRMVVGRGCHFGRIVVWSTAALLMSALHGSAQSNAPLTPPPSEEHDVRRMGNEPEAPAPPSLPPAEIIQKFTNKEDQFASARARYGSRKTIRIEEFGPDGKPAGQFLWVTETTRAANGQVINKTVQKPQSTLQYLKLEPEDVKELDRIPAFPLTSAQLAKYDLKYIGQEQVDEIDAYIFQVKPKELDRAHAYLEGVVWVDTKYLEVVKTYGRWVNELGDVKIANMPFAVFETYRENVDGKYWFPSYERSDDTLHEKDLNVPLRLVIKWTDFKPLPAAAAPSATPQTPPASTPPSTTPPA